MSAALEPDVPGSSGASKIREWVRAKLDSSEQVAAPFLAEAAVAVFIHDEAVVFDVFRRAVYDMVIDCIHKDRVPVVLRPVPNRSMRRSKSSKGGFVVNGKELSAEELKERSENTAKMFFRSWMEHVGNAHIHLFDMTKDDIDMAMGERSARIATEQKRIEFLGAVSEPMDEDERVRDRFSPIELFGIYKGIFGGNGDGGS